MSSLEVNSLNLDSPIANELKSLEKLLVSQVHLNSRLEPVIKYVLNGKGKRLRPTILLLSAGMCGRITNQHLQAAGAIEYIHLATLLHDDVIDSAKLRHGKTAANIIWDNKIAVLAGDVLYSLAFKLLLGIQNWQLLDLITTTTQVIANGEALQLGHNIENCTEATYLEAIKAKTASLFSTAARSATFLTNTTSEASEALISYAFNLGIAYQLTDDLEDYYYLDTVFGKDTGNDLASGKITLPLINLFNSSTKARQFLKENFFKYENHAKIREEVLSSNALEYTRNLITYYLHNAANSLKIFENCRYAKAAYKLLDYIMQRSSGV